MQAVAHANQWADIGLERVLDTAGDRWLKPITAGYIWLLQGNSKAVAPTLESSCSDGNLEVLGPATAQTSTNEQWLQRVAHRYLTTTRCPSPSPQSHLTHRGVKGIAGAHLGSGCSCTAANPGNDKLHGPAGGSKHSGSIGVQPAAMDWASMHLSFVVLGLFGEPDLTTRDQL